MPKTYGLTAQIFLKMILAALAVLVVTVLGVDFLASRVAREWYIQTLRDQLRDKARMLAVMDVRGVREIPRAQLALLSQASEGRITAIDRSGRVVADSSVDNPDRLENHSGRPEVASALRGEPGSHIRVSRSTGIEYLYVAVPAAAGVLRLAIPMSDLDEQIGAVRRQLVLAVTAAFLPVALFSLFFARVISRRLGRIIQFAQTLAEGKFNERIEAQGKDELSVLSGKLNETAGKLDAMFNELEREKSELKKLERIRKDFVINVSHELRTPLASIQGYAETLLDGALQDEENNVRFVGIIKQNAERLTNLTADLLTLSRIELKMQKFQMAGYYAARLMRDTVDAMRPLAQKKGIELAVTPPPATAEIFCDREAFHQILANLIDNAIKYTPQDRTVAVEAREVTVDARQMVEFLVRDQGIGIPTEDLPRLFERFYRVDKARSRELGGTGLGLAIVKHLAHAHGGEVYVQSQLNQGSTFSFTLPVEGDGLLEIEQLPSKELTAS